MRTKLYGLYHSIKTRCYNKNCKDYPRYGGRGITMCDEWLNDYDSFAHWAVQNGYEPDKGLQIDRSDNSKGYSPDNCKFVSVEMNSRNRRTNTMVTLNGTKMCVADWCEAFNIPKQTIYNRIGNMGMTPEQALKKSLQSAQYKRRKL